jgi:urease accessory protein
MSGPHPLSAHQRAIVSVAIGFAGGRVISLDQRAPMRALFPMPKPGDPPLAALVNTGGGLVGGDKITQAIQISDGPATATIAAAEKVYRPLGLAARVETRLALESGGLLERLPQETILFDGARLDRRLTIALVPGARLLAAEMLVFGRAA